MWLKVSALRCIDVRIIKDGEVLFEGNVDDAPEDLRDTYYKSINGAYPIEIEI